jgi:hypothetical protein
MTVDVRAQLRSMQHNRLAIGRCGAHLSAASQPATLSIFYSSPKKDLCSAVQAQFIISVTHQTDRLVQSRFVMHLTEKRYRAVDNTLRYPFQSELSID